ncbi:MULTISPECIES: thioredoxin domain-containing protein [unclassified Pseudomonas]|uniref:DsbA family protein n=1 Tax=unclassified Pseudomonas TaxID=196821 RepID=UPI002114D26C|nr:MULTISPECIES: thioredoxin domain-containing protein [unclassified Pseudomonas]
MTAEFAGSRGFFWEAHAELYEDQRRLGLSLFERIVLTHGLSSEELKLALDEETYRSKIKADFNGGVRSVVNGTPSFYIDGHRYDGPPDFAGLRKAIEFVMASERSR